MGKFDIFDTIDQLRNAGQPFCVATVLRTADATSAKAGAKAAITDDGEIHGHLGGACVQRAVRKAAEEARETGEPKLIRVKPSEKVVSLYDEDGVELHKSGCPSGGTADVLIEPFDLAPMLVIFGDTPISRAVAAHARLAGYRLALPAHAEGERAFSFEGTDLSGVPVRARDFVLVAVQGKGDRATLRAALESPARRVAMVASRRKAQVLTDKLIAEGMSASRVLRLKSPAGLDIHATDPHEIALSVMAEITLWRHTDRADVQEAGTALP